MSHKKDRRLVQSEQAIIEAGISLLLVNPAAGMSEIAQAAGVGRATLYRHFETREALIRKLALICLEETDRALEPYEHLSGKALIEKIVDVLMPMADRFCFLVNLWSYVENDDEVKSIEARMDGEMRYVLNRAKDAGEIRPDLPTSWLSVLFNNTITSGWMLVNSGEATSDQAASYAKKTFFDGCAYR